MKDQPSSAASIPLDTWRQWFGARDGASPGASFDRWRGRAKKPGNAFAPTEWADTQWADTEWPAPANKPGPGA